MNSTTLTNGRKAGLIPGDLLSLKQVCARYGICARMLWRWIQGGIFPPPVLLGGIRRWRRDDVERIAREGTPAPEVNPPEVEGRPLMESEAAVLAALAMGPLPLKEIASLAGPAPRQGLNALVGGLRVRGLLALTPDGRYVPGPKAPPPA
jgi:predicted DNA-binding transcriptional regulator AlpA